MYSKIEEFVIFDSAINWFNSYTEKINANLYSFPKKITYTNGSTSGAYGKITINGVIFSKFTFKEPLEYISEAGGYSALYPDLYPREVHPPLINIGFSYKKDISIGVIGFLILLNFHPMINFPTFYVFFSIPFCGLVGFLLLVFVSDHIPSCLSYGLRERIANKLNALNEDIIDQNIKNVLLCWIRDPHRNYAYFDIVCPKCKSGNFNTFSCFGTVKEYKNAAGEVTGFDDASEDQYNCKDCGHTWFDEWTKNY